MTSMQQQAELLTEMGYAVFPCRDPENDPCEVGKKGKMPLTPNGVKDATIDLVQVDRWWTQWPTANIGLSCKNCLVIDIDNKDGKNGSEDFERVTESLGPIDSVSVAATGSGGFHYFFARPEVDIVGQTGVEWNGQKTGIDIRVGNQYVIAPPSLHESGKRYSWDKPLVPPEQLPPVPQAWIDGFLPKRHHAAGPQIGASAPAKLIAPGGRLLSEHKNISQAVSRCKKYVGTMPEAVDGQGGHNTTISVANAIFWGFGLDEQTGWPILCEYNQRCKPPWSDYELRHKMNEARDKPSNRDFCWLLNANRNRYQLGDFDCKNNEIETDDEPSSVCPWRPFPVESLPSIVAQHVLANAAASGCDPANVALADLVVLASAIGNSRRLQLKRGWIFPSIIWGMIIARKSSIKTWSMVPSVRPLHMMQEEYHREYDREKSEYDRRRNEYMLLPAKERRKEPPFELIPPVRRRILSRDATEARIIKNMSENPRGFCVFCDELTTLIKGFGQYTKDGKGGNGQSIFNTIFNGEGIESERMDESRYSPNACISILGSIQPGMLKRCFDQEAFESGFASRFLITSPPLRVASWTDAFVSEDIETDFHSLVFDLLRLEMEPIFAEATVEYDEWNPEGVTRSGEQIGVRPALIDTSPEALVVYQEFFDRTVEEMRATDDDNVRGAFEKHRAYVARLALVIHVVRVV